MGKNANDRALKTRRMIAEAEGKVLPEDLEDARETVALVDLVEQEARLARWRAEEERQDEVSGAAERRRHRVREMELRKIRRKLDRSAKGHQAQAAGLIEGRENERLSEAEYGQFHRAVNRLASEADLRDKLKALEKREKAAAAVTREPGPYEEGSPHSWVRDVLVARDPQMGLVDLRSGLSDMQPEAVAERLGQHAHDVHRAVLKRSKYGRVIEATIRESRRQEDAVEHERLFRQDFQALRLAEIRSLTTGGGVTASASGGGAAAFVAPAFLIDDVWAEYRSPYRAFADQCNTSVALPSYGMEVYLTQITTGTLVATQTELSGVSEQDPVATLGNSPVVTKGGQIAVSQQFLDRAGPGISGDAVMFKQLREQLDAQVDSYAISQALAGVTGPGNVTNSGTFAMTNGSTAGVGGFLKDLKSAKNALHDTAGVRLRGTHCFATGDFVDYVSSYNDASGRPMFSPAFDDNCLPIRAVGDPNGEGFSGYVLVGLALYADDNIPLSGSNAQIIVTRPDHILLLEGAPMPYCYPPTFAGNLEAVLGVRSYVATIARFPAGVSVISGAAYAASTFQ